MPHQCVRCGKIYGNASEEILKGCTECGGKLFFFIKDEVFERIKNKEQESIRLSDKQKKEIERDIKEILDLPEVIDEPIVLDLESIHVKGPGKYELDLVKIFSKKPVIVKVGEGKYIIDIAETMKNFIKDKD